MDLRQSKALFVVIGLLINIVFKTMLKRNLMKKLFGGVLGLLLMAMGLVGCVDESFTTDPSMRLSFSVDTLSFDTLFSSIPSRTAIFKVYNKHDKALNIDMIRLGGGANSYFRFNADGRIPGDGNVLTDVIIRSNDSLYIFVEITALESSEAMPVMVLDSMEFWSNNNRQDVKLMAYSQDAIIFRGHSHDGDTELSQERREWGCSYLHVPATNTVRVRRGRRRGGQVGARVIG